MWFKSKKIWVGFITLVGFFIAPEHREQILILGAVLIGGISLQDVGKANTLIQAGQLDKAIQAAKEFMPALVSKSSETFLLEADGMPDFPKLLVEGEDYPDRVTCIMVTPTHITLYGADKDADPLLVLPVVHL